MEGPGKTLTGKVRPKALDYDLSGLAASSDYNFRQSGRRGS